MIALIQEFAGIGMTVRAMSDTTYEFSATRQGETTRKCVKCGSEFVPNSRNQKYCDGCKRKPVYEKKESKRAQIARAKRRITMSNDHSILALNDALFRQLERIENANSPEEIEAENTRAASVCCIASNVIANGKLMLKAAEASIGTAEAVNVPKALLGDAR